MILALSFEKRGGIVDDARRAHKPFTICAVSETLYRKLVAQNRFICEAHEFVDGVRDAYPENIVRQHARNAGLSADGTLDDVRARLMMHVISASEDVMRAHMDASSFDNLRKVLGEVKTVLTSPPAKAAEQPPVEPPAAPPQPPVDEPSTPLVPDEALADGAWEALASAYEAQDFKAARSALAALTDEPTPAKAVELWPVVETTLRTRGLLS